MPRSAAPQASLGIEVLGRFETLRVSPLPSLLLSSPNCAYAFNRAQRQRLDWGNPSMVGRAVCVARILWRIGRLMAICYAPMLAQPGRVWVRVLARRRGDARTCWARVLTTQMVSTPDSVRHPMLASKMRTNRRASRSMEWRLILHCANIAVVSLNKMQLANGG